VVFPAEDGGYVLIGARAPFPALFADMRWSTAGVMTETRSRLKTLGLTWQEPLTLWDIDVPQDLARLRAAGLELLLHPGPAGAKKKPARRGGPSGSL
jgi:glycosyltransferase A (GT-A) superfamily protein (DUF2064 family)